MRKVLYITNIEAPYKVKFLNEMSKECELTVIYERKKSKNRDVSWNSNDKKFKFHYLSGIDIASEYAFSFGIFKYVFNDYDEIIFSCYNSPTQIMAMLLMRLLNKKYWISTDGEVFANGKSFKDKLKRFLLRGASLYLVAGETCNHSIQDIACGNPIVPYYFSSLYYKDILSASSNRKEREDNYVLVVGQYYDYKGLDIAISAAKQMPYIKFKFVGTGKRTNMFIRDYCLTEIGNIEVVDFMQPKDLAVEYDRASLLLLPSRRECWGLVVNEAASHGTPIVSTEGSGAAVEFLSPQYKENIVESCNVSALVEAINNVINLDEHRKEEYSNYLIEKSKNYSIEHMVKAHLDIINGNEREK